MMKSVKNMTDDEIIKHLKNGVITLNAKGLRDKKQTADMCLAAVNKDGFAIQHVKDKTPEICLAAVSQNGNVLRFIKPELRTEDICMAAVNQNGLALQYIRYQTEDICLAAVKQCGLALRYAKFQTDEMCLYAIKTYNIYSYFSSELLSFVHNQTPEICLAAVSKDGLSLRFVIEQTPEICLEAVKQNPQVLGYKIISDDNRFDVLNLLLDLQCDTSNKDAVISAAVKKISTCSSSMIIDDIKICLKLLLDILNCDAYKDLCIAILNADDRKGLNFLIKYIDVKDRAFYLDKVAGNKKFQNMFGRL